MTGRVEFDKQKLKDYQYIKVLGYLSKFIYRKVNDYMLNKSLPSDYKLKYIKYQGLQTFGAFKSYI